MHAGARRATIASKNAHWVVCDRRVDAHRSLEIATDDNDRFDILCNSYADESAKAAHGLHGVSEDQWRELTSSDTKYRLILKVLTGTIPLWPSTTRIESTLHDDRALTRRRPPRTPRTGNLGQPSAPRGSLLSSSARSA